MPDLLLGLALVVFLVFAAALKPSRASPGLARPRPWTFLWTTGALGVTLYVLGAVATLVGSDFFWRNHADEVDGLSARELAAAAVVVVGAYEAALGLIVAAMVGLRALAAAGRRRAPQPTDVGEKRR